ITAAVLKLVPRPTEVETAWLALQSPEQAVSLLAHMRARFGEQVTAFELMQRSLIDLLLEGVPGNEDPLSAPHPWYVLVEIGGQGAPGSLSEPFADALAAAFEAELVTDAV